ncbi:hypothetical protein JFL43_05605 [Viridibacillus sp. YIM B01967]|uniref:Uncharacterized protein n=1 Tax=Viridibacillus soli TaxID=2798301 RepID=A0ABS1H4M6_9BACL|nr:hypothetical protein [Viridibacillus soli]MBK3494340.1 hypothetical protein [Viridibacillus soli]
MKVNAEGARSDSTSTVTFETKAFFQLLSEEVEVTSRVSRLKLDMEVNAEGARSDSTSTVTFETKAFFQLLSEEVEVTSRV